MNQKTLLKLEYDKIINLLVNEASSENGKKRCQELVPMTDLEEINTAEEQTAAAFTRLVKKGRLSFSGCYSVEASMKRLEVGAALSAPELLRICKLCETANRAKAYGRHETVDELADCLDIYFEQLSPLTPLSMEIRRCILSEDEIAVIVEEAINESNATSVKDMGNVMRIVSPKLKGKADMSLVSAIIKNKLN